MSFHERIVEEIQKKMAGPSMLKSEEEKKQEIFQYDQSQQNNILDENPHNRFHSSRNDLLLTADDVKKSLQEIYSFYINSYIQPRKNYETFDQVNNRKLTFQPFILFMKHFNLLKTIFSLQKIKVFFNRYSNYGRFLTLENFIFLINQMAHEPEAKKFFGIPMENMDLQTEDQLQKQQLYNYMSLHNPVKYRRNFRSYFQPFNCQNKPERSVKKYSYRKFSVPELRKKALPPRNQQEEPDLYVVKNRQNFTLNPFEQAKSIVVSWDTLRANQPDGIQYNSAEVVKKKYVKNDQITNDPYLTQYEIKQTDMRNKVEKKIKEMQREQSQRNRLLISKLKQRQQKMTLKTSSSRKSLKKISNWK